MQSVMKKTISISVRKGVIALSTVVALVILFLILGFRITYAPWLKSDWTAIDAVGTWVAVIVSGIAIWTAIIIPKRIAENQNKIELFEKRYDFYNNLISCISFNKMLELCDNPELFDFIFVSAFTNYQDEKYEPGSEEYLKTKYSICQSLYNSLKQGRFLFNFDMEKNVTKLCMLLMTMVYSESLPNNYLESRAEYMSVTKELEEKVIPQVEKTLRLSEIA